MISRTLQNWSHETFTQSKISPHGITAVPLETIRTGALLRIAESLEKLVVIAEKDTTADNISKLTKMLTEKNDD